MFLLDWYREFREIRSQSHCDSCDILRAQLELANFEKGELLVRLMDKASPPQVVEIPSARVEKQRPRPWPVIKKELEREDHIRAQAIKAAGKPDSVIIGSTQNLTSEVSKISTEELEKEVLEEVK